MHGYTQKDVAALIGKELDTLQHESPTMELHERSNTEQPQSYSYQAQVYPEGHSYIDRKRL